MTLGDIVVLAALGLILGCVIGKLWKDRKKGKCCGCGSCGCCSACAGYAEGCAQEKKEKEMT